jgi:hypothetical protein
MTKWLAFGKYTSDAAAKILKEGYQGRAQALADFAKASGNEQLGYWAISDPEWDFVTLQQGDNFAAPTQAAVGLMASGAGVIARGKFIELVEAADADAAVQGLTGYRPPGS